VLFFIQINFVFVTSPNEKVFGLPGAECCNTNFTLTPCPLFLRRGGAYAENFSELLPLHFREGLGVRG